MQIFDPPERKCQVVLQAKSDFKAKIKRNLKSRKNKKKLKLIEEQLKEKLQQDETKKKDKLLEIFELYTNTISVVEDKQFARRKLLKKFNEEDKINIELAKGYEEIEDCFLTKQELMDLRKNYSDLSIGDFAIVFNNPDTMKDNKPIGLQDALKIYDNVLTVITDDPIMTREEISKQRQAFIRAFLSLEEYATKEEIYKESIKKNVSQIQIEEEKTHKNKKLNAEKAIETQTFKTKLTKEIQEDQDAEEMKDLIKNAVETKENDLSYFFNLNIDDLSKFNKIKKNYAMGGYMSQEPIPDSDEFDWICKSKPPSDFLTLVRNVIMTKLSRNAFMHLRSFVTSNGQKIVLILKSDEEMIKREAETSFLDKQIELGACDLFSLEPVDAKGRPLRMKPYLRKPQFPPDLEEMPDIEKEDRETGVSVSSRAQTIFQKIMKMSDFQLQKLLVNKQMRVDPWLSKLASQLNIDLKKSEDFLEDDNSINRETWETYYLYLAYLEEFLTRFEGETNPKGKNLVLPEVKDNKYFIYKLIFLKSLGDSNEISYMFYRNACLDFCGLDSSKKKDRLLNIWNHLGTDPIPPFMNYTDNGDSIWRSYEKNERGQRSKFLGMERLKMVNKILSKHLHIIRLIKLKIVDSTFAIHDFYQVNGDFNTPIFKKLYDTKYLVEPVDTKGEKRVKQYFVMMADEAEKTDFDTDGSSLADDIAFNWAKPWEISIESLRNYFGEKIAIYFSFLSFYTLNLMPMAILGIIAQIVINYASLMVSNGMKMAFSFLIIIWSTVFIELWKRKQSLFAVQFGQINSEKAEAERPSFKGQFIRSIHNDDINVLYFSPKKKILKTIISYFISISILVCVIVCVILILYFKDYLYTCGCVDTSNSLIAAIPSIINSIQIQIFNAIYQNVALSLNEFENHKLLSMYENSLVFKIFAFTFVNTFNSLVIISFMSSLFPSLDICKISTTGEIDCFQAVAVQMQTLFLTAFIKNLPELMVPYLKLYLMQKNKKKSEKLVEHPFFKIDQRIEDQLDKAAYAANLEVDGTLADYMELVIQFGFLTLFSVNFPISFLLAFITNIAEIQVDKIKIVWFTRRPIPENAKDLGTWFLILDFLSFLSIFFNAALIAYTSSCIYLQDSNTKNKVFVLFIIFFLSLKYLIKILIDDVPERTKIVEMRHNFLKDRLERAGQRKHKMRSAKINLAIEGLSKPFDKEEYNQEKINLIQSKTIREDIPKAGK